MTIMCFFQIECQKETDTIRVHSVSLSVGDKDVTVKRSSDKKHLVVNNVQFDEDNDFLVIKVTFFMIKCQ